MKTMYPIIYPTTNNRKTFDRKKPVKCEDVKGTKHDKCWKGRDLISCNYYLDKNMMVQRKCSCGPINKSVQFPNFVINGCGPMSVGRGIGKNPFNSLVSFQEITCCNKHDRCMNQIVDSGVCAEEFTKCLRSINDYSMLGSFKRNVMVHFVRTSSYDQIVSPAEHKCYRIHKPRLASLQPMHQHELWSIVRQYK